MSKLPDLTEMTQTVAVDDMLYIVDESEKGDSVDGSSRFIKIQNFGGKYLLNTITNSTADEFDFSSIPAGFRRLVIEGHVKSDDSGTNADNIIMFINADDTAANYWGSTVVHNGFSASGHDEGAAYIAVIAGDGANVVGDSQIRIVIEGYESVSRIKTAQSWSMVYYSEGARIDSCMGAWSHDNSSADINRIRIRTDNHPTDRLTGTLRLYGEM